MDEVGYELHLRNQQHIQKYFRPAISNLSSSLEQNRPPPIGRKDVGAMELKGQTIHLPTTKKKIEVQLSQELLEYGETT